MGYLLIDGRTAGEGIREYNTTTCGHCSSIIIYSSKPMGNFLRQIRTSFNQKTGKREDELGSGYWCQRCNSDICKFCGDKVFRTVDKTGGCSYALGI